MATAATRQPGPKKRGRRDKELAKTGNVAVTVTRGVGFFIGEGEIVDVHYLWARLGGDGVFFHGWWWLDSEEDGEIEIKDSNDGIRDGYGIIAAVGSCYTVSSLLRKAVLGCATIHPRKRPCISYYEAYIFAWVHK